MPKKHDIPSAIAAVEKIHAEAEKRSPRPELPPGRITDDYWEAHRAHSEAGRKVVQRLVDELGGRFSLTGAHDHRLTLAGVSTSCTSGEWGLITNWLRAARRKLAKV